MPRRPKVDWEELYYSWWKDFGRNRAECLRAYGLYDGTTKHGTPSRIWSENLYNHKDEYLKATERWFNELGVTIEDCVIRLDDLSRNPVYNPRVRLDATVQLLQYMTTTRNIDRLETSTKKFVEEIIDGTKDGVSNEDT